jgi:hypothetical protein
LVRIIPVLLGAARTAAVERTYTESSDGMRRARAVTGSAVSHADLRVGHDGGAPRMDALGQLSADATIGAAVQLTFWPNPHNSPWQLRANGCMVGGSRPPGAGESRPVPAAEGATGPRKRSGTRDRGGIGTSGKTAGVTPAAPTE